MSAERRRRNAVVALLLILLLLALLLVRCSCKRPVDPGLGAAPVAAQPPAEPVAQPAGPTAAQESDEDLTPATLQAPVQVLAGSAFSVSWTGPDNPGDYVTVVRAGTPDGQQGNYRETKTGRELELTAPVEPGEYELRYLTGRSRTVLARVPLRIAAAGATLQAPDEVVLGAPVVVEWTGPDNRGDYVTIVMQDTPDGVYGNYTDTERGSPLTVSAPTTVGQAEVRYMTGQGNTVLARRPLRIRAAEVSLAAPDEAVAGATVAVEWTGPDNAGDYVTVVAAGTPDEQYGNYLETRQGSPLALLMPILEGAAELRYVTGQGNRVLARRAIRLVAAAITLSAPDEASAGSTVTITWTGPDHSGDYLTIVPAGASDEQYGGYANTSSGSPLGVLAPKEPGAAEIRYVAGQGRKVLARRPLRITP